MRKLPSVPSAKLLWKRSATLRCEVRRPIMGACCRRRETQFSLGNVDAHASYCRWQDWRSLLYRRSCDSHFLRGDTCFFLLIFRVQTPATLHSVERISQPAWEATFLRSFARE